MTPHSLICHPSAVSSAIRSCSVALAFDAEAGLRLSYRLTGDPSRLCLPALRPAGPSDGLWQHTCCEAFIGVAPGDLLPDAVDATQYREFNFSPSGQWAAYRFDDYRVRDLSFSAPLAPQICLHPLADGFQLDVLLAPALLPVAERLQIGLSAVVEDSDGTKTYWALVHAAAQPDFHLRQSFALTLKVSPP